MAKTTKKKKSADEDEAQSRRFIELAEKLAADGDLNLTEAEEAFERRFPSIAKAVKRDSKD